MPAAHFERSEALCPTLEQLSFGHVMEPSPLRTMIKGGRQTRLQLTVNDTRFCCVDQGTTPLFAAVRSGHLDVVRWLHAHGAAADNCRACRGGQVRALDKWCCTTPPIPKHSLCSTQLILTTVSSALATSRSSVLCGPSVVQRKRQARRNDACSRL